MQELKKAPLPLANGIDFEQIKRNLSDEGAERAVLACLIKEPALMVECSAKITSVDFTNESNAYLYEIMVSLFKRNGGKDCRFDIATLQQDALL